MTRVKTLERRNLMFGGILVLLAAWLVFRPAETSVLRKDALPPLFPDLTVEKVRSIEIARAPAKGAGLVPGAQPTERVEIQRAGELAWTVESSFGYPALADKVIGFLEALQDAKRKGFVTEQEATFDDYADAEGWISIRVDDAEGKALARFELGKDARWSEPYVRIQEGGKPVIVRAINLSSDKVRMSLASWADVSLWPGLTLPAVEAIDVFQKEEKGTLAFVREEREVEKEASGTPEDGAAPTDVEVETVWLMRAPKEAEAVKHEVENLVRAFTGMRADRIAARDRGGEQAEAYGLKDPSYRIVVKTPSPQPGGRAVTSILVIGKKVPGETPEDPSDAWYVQRRGDDWIFEVGGASVAIFQEPSSTYLPPEPEETDEGAETDPPKDDAPMGDPDGEEGAPEDMPPLPPLPPEDPK